MLILPEINGTENQELGYYFGGENFISSRRGRFTISGNRNMPKNILNVSAEDDINPKIKGILKVRYDSSGSPLNRSLIGDQDSFENQKKYENTKKDA